MSKIIHFKISGIVARQSINPPMENLRIHPGCRNPGSEKYICRNVELTPFRHRHNHEVV